MVFAAARWWITADATNPAAPTSASKFEFEVASEVAMEAITPAIIELMTFNTTGVADRNCW